MAGFLRKKSKQDPRSNLKPGQVSPPVVTPVVPSAPSVPPPLYARFASSNNASQESHRIISAPMVLSSARKDAVPAPQIRGGRASVSGNSVKAVRRETTKEVEARGLRNQSNSVVKTLETQLDDGIHRHSLQPQLRQPQPGSVAGNGVKIARRDNQDVEARRRLNEPSSVATVHDLQNNGGSRASVSHAQQVPSSTTQTGSQARARSVSRIPALNKPLPPTFPSEPSGSNSPTTPTQASVLQNRQNDALRTIIDNKVLPQPQPPTVAKPTPLPRTPSVHVTDLETLKRHRTFSLTSPPDLFISTLEPKSSLPAAQPVHGSNDPPISPLLNNQTKLHLSSSTDPDHISRQTSTSRPSHRSDSRQDLQDDQNRPRPGSGASTSQTVPVPENALAPQHQRLLEVLHLPNDVKETEQNPAKLLNSRALAASSDGNLPDIPSDKDIDTSVLPSSPSSPVPHRGSSTAKHTGPSPLRHLESTSNSALPTHATPVAPEPQHVPSPSMGINSDISRVQAYRNVQPQIANVGHRAGTSAPLSSVAPQQPRLSVTPTSPSRPHPDTRSANLPPPSKQGKPLIFTAMAAISQGSNQMLVPGLAPPFQAPASVPVEHISQPSRPHPPPAQYGHPFPPIDFIYPQRKQSLPQHPQHPQHPQPQSFNQPQHPLQPPQPQAYNQPQHPLQPQPQSFNQPQHPQQQPQPFHQPHNTQQSTSPLKEVQSHPMGTPTKQIVQGNEHIAHRSPSKIKKLSKARTAGKSASDLSTVSSYSHSSSNSVTGTTHRPSSSKGTSSTPSSTSPRALPPDPVPVRIEGDVGVPLDDDPFASVGGVQVVDSISRPASPTGATLKARRSKSTLRSTASRDELRAEFHDLPQRKLSTEEQISEVIPDGELPTSPDILTEAGDEEARKDVPDTSSVAEEQGDQGEKAEQEEEETVVVEEEEEDQEDRLTGFLSDPRLLWALLPFLSFYDWCLVLSLSRVIRHTFVRNPQLREAVLERFLRPVGYARWAWDEPDPLELSLQNLSDYMRGVSTPPHEYARVAGLYVHSLSVHPKHRDDSLNDMVAYLGASCRAYTRVVLRIRAQAEVEVRVVRPKGTPRAASSPSSRTSSPTSSASHSNQSHRSGGHTPWSPSQGNSALSSPLFRLGRAPLLRVFVPSPDGEWLSDKSVLTCEAECRRAGVTSMMRVGDVVWDVAVGDEGNVGRLVWDGSYLIDLDYTYSPVGDLPKYMPTLAFPPSYFHRVIRLGPGLTNPIAHIDIRPWGEEIAHNLQLLQDRVRTETPQGTYHNVVRWVNRSSFVIRPLNRGAMWSPNKYNGYPGPVSSRIPIPDSNGLFVDPGWYGTIVVETEGTNEALADLADRCGPGVFPLPQTVNGRQVNREQKKVFRILREKSRPGEIWIRAVSAKERLL